MCSCILWTLLQHFSEDGLARQCSHVQLSHSPITNTAANTSRLSLYPKCVCNTERGLLHTNNGTVWKKTSSFISMFQWDQCSRVCVTEENEGGESKKLVLALRALWSINTPAYTCKDAYQWHIPLNWLCWLWINYQISWFYVDRLKV